MALSAAEASALSDLYDKWTLRKTKDRRHHEYVTLERKIEQLGMAIPAEMRRFLVMLGWPRRSDRPDDGSGGGPDLARAPPEAIRPPPPENRNRGPRRTSVTATERSVRPDAALPATVPPVRLRACVRLGRFRALTRATKVEKGQP